ncbi:EpsG family protein [Leclercia sp.]|uniref:EpsG family protein n=1 Tax=Leclercia sp. TaxID=1898428 RepID=UPI002FDDD77A
MYLIILIYLLCCSLVNNKSITGFNIFVTFCIMSGWYFPAYDWMNYHDFYARIDTVGYLNSTFEPGFTALMKFCAFFNFDYHVVYILSNAIIYFFIYKYCMKFPRPGFVFFFIFSLFGFVLFAEQIRQGIALAILLYASGRRKFIFYALIACLFHYSAVFAIGLEYIINSDDKRRKRLTFIFAGCLAVVVGFILLGMGSPVFDFINNKLANHLNVNILAPSFMVGLLLYFMFPFFCLYKNRNNIISKKWQYFCFTVILLGVPFPVFNRFTYYCYPYIIPDMEKLFSRYIHRAILILAIVFILGLRIVISPIYLPLMSDYHFYIPGLTDAPNYESIRIDRCIILRNNDVNDFC